MATEHSSNWIKWWNTETIVTPEIWGNNMKIFITMADRVLHFNPNDIVLDIGCGPGYLASFLKNRVQEIHCLDTAQRYLDIARERFAIDSNVFCYRLDEEDYTDLTFLKDKKFSKIVCLSVIQYYKDISEVEKLIEGVQKISFPGALFLIADIPVTANLAVNMLGSLKMALREKRLFEMFSLYFRITTSKHREAYSSLGLLTISDKKLQKLVEKLLLNAEILRSKLTINGNRRHLLIRF